METLGAQATTDKNAAESAKEAAEAAANDATIALCGYPSCHCWRPDAISAVLCHYSGYITHMSLRTLHDEQGNSYLCVDEAMRRKLEMKLLAGILAFHVA